jgi:hypothetical protein
VVYRGRDLRTRRDVALKTLRPEYRKDPETRARFRREARTMAFLSHPNVIKVYDLFEDDDAPWAVMEFAAGRSLKDEIQERRIFSIEETAGLLEQIAGALDHLHARGQVHLDVKPQNVMVTPDLAVKLIDFGLTQPMGQSQEMIGGTAFGTAAYISPEQACGDPVGVPTDVYALGCVVYEMLTGEPPFGGDPATQVKDDVIRAHLEEQPDSPSKHRSLPEWVDDAVLTALAKKPEDRFPTCSAFAETFWDGLGEHELVIAPATTTARIQPARTSPPSTVESFDEIFPTAPKSRPGISRSLYVSGGRLARHTGWLQRFLWRATLALLVGNLLLAGLLYFDRGEVPGVVAGSATIQTGSDARVATDRLRLRAGPGRDQDVVGLLAVDQVVRVTGASAESEGETWWPVRAQINGESVDGYVSGGWIEPIGGPGDAWVNRAVDVVLTVPERLLEAAGVTGMVTLR